MCFGQTGSGKTYTTNGVAERAAAALFAALPAGAVVLAVCVEVAGSKIHDLLSDGALGIEARSPKPLSALFAAVDEDIDAAADAERLSSARGVRNKWWAVGGER